MTDAERKLWSLLQRNNLGVKFRRQVPFDSYVLDFYCTKAKLNVELDGSQHNTEKGLRNDRKRDRDLRREGISVLRFSNVEILENPDDVVQRICDAMQKQTQKQVAIKLVRNKSLPLLGGD